ncbi:hypothetical protein DIPPA_31939 [Diplonema papillatum]|nr:hypothetical protein DIPPA_31939 [Diplonema papillatum]
MPSDSSDSKAAKKRKKPAARKKRKRFSSEDDDAPQPAGGERAGALLALKRIRAKAAEEGDETTTTSGSSDGEYVASGSTTTDDSVSFDTSSSSSNGGTKLLKDEDAVKLELSAADYSAYQARLSTVKAWRDKSEAFLSNWQDEQEIKRLAQLQSESVLPTGWAMPSSGQPLPLIGKRAALDDSAQATLKRQTTLDLARDRWNKLKKADEGMRRELTEHQNSAQAYLPRKEFLDKAKQTKATSQAQELKLYELQQKSNTR